MLTVTQIREAVLPMGRALVMDSDGTLSAGDVRIILTDSGCVYLFKEEVRHGPFWSSPVLRAALARLLNGQMSL